jgi:hypothetical protein
LLLKLEVLEKGEVVVTPFESTATATQARRLVHVGIQGAQTRTKVSLTAMESDNIYSLHPTVPREVSTLPFTSKLQMVDPHDTSHNLPIEVLIGGEHYWKIIKDTQPVRLSTSLGLLPSIFGWILSGNRTGVTVNQVSINKVETQQNFDSFDREVRHFWNLEAIGITNTEIKSRPLNCKDESIMQEFSDSFRNENGRIVVSLPKKEDMILPTNRANAERRFELLQRKMARKQDFRQIYCSKMMDYVLQQQVEIAPPKENAGYGQPSLNNTLEIGNEPTS